MNAPAQFTSAKIPLKPKLTPRRRAILDFIADHQRKHNGMSPCLTEIGEAVGLASTSTVHCHCQTLVAMGELRQSETSSMRGYYIPAERRESVAELELLAIRLESEKSAEFQRGYEAGWRACAERSLGKAFTDAQGYPQAASGVE